MYILVFSHLQPAGTHAKTRKRFWSSCACHCLLQVSGRGTLQADQLEQIVDDWLFPGFTTTAALTKLEKFLSCHENTIMATGYHQAGNKPLALGQHQLSRILQPATCLGDVHVYRPRTYEQQQFQQSAIEVALGIARQADLCKVSLVSLRER